MMVISKRRRFKALLAVFGIACAHALLCRAVIAFTLLDPFHHSVSGSAPGMVTLVLVNLTRVLYFPIVTLSLYSRQWFPGDMIYVPIFANSLLWGIAIYFCYRVWRYIRRRSRPGVQA
jgi:hypothetical protein